MKMDKKKLEYEVKEHLVDTTSIITLTMPLNTGIETFVANMSNKVSISSRAINLALAYGGLTRLVKLRDYSKKKLNIDSRHGIIKTAHDVVFGLSVAPPIKTAVYLASGETDWKKIGIGVLGTMGIVGLLAAPMGYAIDVGRDLWGIKKSERTPRYFENKCEKAKKYFAAGLLTGTIALTSGIYGINSQRNIEKENNLEQVIGQDFNNSPIKQAYFQHPLKIMYLQI